MQRIETILRLSVRMDKMLESLLQYSRIGRNELDLHILSIGDLVRQTAEFILQIIPEQNVSIAIQPRLPEVRCDRVRVAIIFQNLIMNAIKYNEKAEKKIEIGCDASSMNPRDIAASYRLGASGYICKPLSLDLFVEKMRGLINYWFDAVTLPDES